MSPSLSGPVFSWDGRCHLIHMPDEVSGFVCLEPQSHAVNAHHLAGHPGLRLLGRGDRMSLGMTLSLCPAP